MEHDCSIQKDEKRFRFRTGGIIVNDGKMLFARSAGADYYYMIGGAVQMGEPTEKCVEREIREETGLNAKAERLAVVCENFFKGFGGVIDGCDCHALEFYYRMKVDAEELNNLKTVTDIGENLVWLPIEKIRTSNIKPAFIKERIAEILSSSEIIHIVEERER